MRRGTSQCSLPIVKIICKASLLKTQVLTKWDQKKGIVIIDGDRNNTGENEEI